MRNLTSKEALRHALMFVSGSIKHGPGGRPGEVIQKLPEKVRAALKGLKSEDTQDRVDWWCSRSIQ